MSLFSGFFVVLDFDLHFPPLVQLLYRHVRPTGVDVGPSCLNLGVFLIVHSLTDILNDLFGDGFHVVDFKLVLLDEVGFVCECREGFLGL